MIQSNKQEDLFLQNICKKCLAHNGSCIKNEPYIGLCAVNDREEILLSKKGLV